MARRTLTPLLVLTLAAAALLPGATAAKDSEIELTTYIFDGIYRGDQRVKITGGSRDVGLAKLKGKTRAFDLTVAQFDIDDTNDDGYRDFRDIEVGDKVEIKSDLKKRRPGKGPFKAYAVKNLTHPRPPRID
jgi:hypothetical protein